MIWPCWKKASCWIRWHSIWVSSPMDRASATLSFFADQGYALHRFIQTPYRGNNLPQIEADLNRVISGLRVTAKWGFGRIGSLLAFCKFEKNLKVLLSPVGKYYRCAVLLTNCHSCLRRNHVSKKFKVRPPHLEEYLQ